MTKQKYLKCAIKPNFISSKVIDYNFVAVPCTKKVLRLNKPIYVGLCVFELSKLKMYQFHYLRVLMFIILVLRISICLILVDIQKILNITVI